MNEIKAKNTNSGNEVAVIGMSARFPGAKNLEEFWDNLTRGIESICFFSHEELLESGISKEILNNPNYIKSRGILEDIDYFDASFFGYLPLEAKVMDPQIRLFHECAWEALENAGYNPGSFEGSIGLYAGAAVNLRWQALWLLKEEGESLDPFSASILKNKDFLCTRISYKLNLKGPSFTLSTACSTSLVAVVLACQGLLIGECDAALAGGVTITFPQNQGYIYKEGMILSPDGHCRTFDTKAGGVIGGNGLGIVVLKLLEDAEADGDHIYAIIKGAAVNNDGIRKAGYTAPSIDGQAEVINGALEMADVEPASIGYIETHGTGTSVGDPIEIEALKMVFRTGKKNVCPIGSVKSNIGHLDHAAGIAGFIKTVLALGHRLIPPSLHFETPNPKIGFQNSPFYVVTRPTEWKPHIPGCPLRAGVSSFGIGGTNAHVVLEEWPDDPSSNAGRRAQSAEYLEHGSWGQGRGGVSPPDQSRQYQLILLSAKTESALNKMTDNLARHLKKNPGTNLADAAYTMQVGRKAFEWRRMGVYKDLDEAIGALTDRESQTMTAFVSPKDSQRPVFFMFPGQGAQYFNMGLGLYNTEPVFREEMDRFFEILTGLLEYGLKEILYPGTSAAPVSDNNRSYRSNRSDKSYKSHIDQTEIAQPLLFAFEYALAKLLMEWGITPAAMIGHSIGEYVAACLSGVFCLEDALKLVVKRGKLMQRLPTGSMLNVPLPEEQLKHMINPDLSIAAVNSSSDCVVSGPHSAIDLFEKLLKEKGYEGRRLHTSHAFHSKIMDPIVKEFEKEVLKVTLNEPKIPYISNLTGTWITHQQALNHEYWGKHLRHTVRFNEGVEHLLEKEGALFIEVGPGRTLSNFVEHHQRRKSCHLTINLIKHAKENYPDDYYLLSKLGFFWLYGKEIDWSSFYGKGKKTRVLLPTYPFERQLYPIPGFSRQPWRECLPDKSSLVKRPNITDWFYVPSWKRSRWVTAKRLPLETNYLVFTNENHLAKQLVKTIEEQGGDIFIVKIGKEFTRESSRCWHINPGKSDHYEQLMREVLALDKIPGCMIHLWNVTGSNRIQLEAGTVKKQLELGFYSLIQIVQAMGKLNYIDDINITIVSDGLHEFTGDEEICPEKSTILGPIKVIPQEYSNIRCRSIDIILPEPGSKNESRVIHQLLTESGPSNGYSNRIRDTIVAYRGDFRWVQAFEPLELEEAAEASLPVKKGGVYLIIGGVGKIGFLLAQYLARTFKAKLILTGRSPFPPRKEWKQWLDTHDREDAVSRKIINIQELETSGAEFMIFSSDISDYEQMQRVFTLAEEQFGHLDGIVHSADVLSNVHRPIELIDKDYCQKQFQTKIYGLLVLERILQERNQTGKAPAFCLLMSSLSSILGGLGFTAYSAANLFMDSFGCVHARRSSQNWVSVNWDGWDFRESAPDSSSSRLAITPEEGLDTFQHLFSLEGIKQLVVSGGDLEERINRWIRLETLTVEDEPGSRNVTPPLRLRPYLHVPYEKPQNSLEQKLSEILQEFFGIEKIGINDNFFELGATSLNIIQINHIARKKLQQDISVMRWLEYPTVKSLSRYLLTQAGENPGAEAEEKEKEKEEKRVQAERKGKTRLELLKKRVTKN